jgi:gamma-glutamyltranspeptidase/glutathione hydrolase
MRVLRSGGNAVDAAVATALALAVTYPQAGNLGGGGFMLIALRDGRAEMLDYRETAPRRLNAEQLPVGADRQPIVTGPLSVAVPGTVAGLAAALERYGTLPWERLVHPAVELAERGFWLTSRQAGYFELYQRELSAFPATRRYFLPGNQPPLPGTLFCQADLGRTLRILAERGARAFYDGEIAAQIAGEIARGGGVLDAEDLASYQVRWRAPLRRRFLGREVITSSLPSAGGLVVATCLGLLEPLGLMDQPMGSIARHDLVAQGLRIGAALQLWLGGDPDHLSPSARQLTETIAQRAMTTSDLARLERALTRRLSPGPRGVSALAANTTHFCVVDGQGNAVSNTYSLNTMFGSKLAVDGAGFLLNSSIDDFRIAAEGPNWYGILQGERNRLAPGRRPVSSMAPTVVSSGGIPELVVGGSGGPRIPSLVVQTIVSVLADGMTLQQAMTIPRIHHQHWPDQLFVEPTVPQNTVRVLRTRGHAIETVPNVGIGAGIHCDPRTTALVAMLDPRFSYE